LTLSGSNSYTGTTFINAGTLNLGGFNALAGGGSVTFGGGVLQFGVNLGTLTSTIANSSAAMAIDTNGFNGTISGNLTATNTGGLMKLGGGTLTLSGSNSYTGTTSY